jgi:hypothetical protein
LGDENGEEFVGKKTDRYYVYVVGYEYLALAIKYLLFLNFSK